MGKVCFLDRKSLQTFFIFAEFVKKMKQQNRKKLHFEKLKLQQQRKIKKLQKMKKSEQKNPCCVFQFFHSSIFKVARKRQRREKRRFCIPGPSDCQQNVTTSVCDVSYDEEKIDHTCTWPVMVDPYPVWNFYKLLKILRDFDADVSASFKIDIIPQSILMLIAEFSLCE